MLTEKNPSDRPGTSPAAKRPVEVDDLICYFEGDFVPMRDARVSIMTHAFMYGTAVFEGIRGYWNDEEQKLYGLKIREHVERIRLNARMLLMDPLPSVDELSRLILETVRRNGFREDVYIRPSFYKSSRQIGVRLHHLEHELYIVALPFGNYIDTDAGRQADVVVLAAERGRRDPGPGQVRRRLREHGVPEVRGRAQRVRRGPRDDP